MFAPQVDSHPVADREALIDLLVVATDVNTRKLLHRDRKLDRETAEQRVRHMISALVAAPMEGD